MKAVGVVHLFQPRGVHAGKLEAGKHAAGREHARRLGQRGGGARDVANAKRNRVGVKRRVGEWEGLGVAQHKVQAGAC